MKNSPSNQEVNITHQYKIVVDMLAEIESLQKELTIINDNLLKAANHSCSEYGDRVLQNVQSKLFYLQRVLKDNTKTLKKHREVLKEIIDNKVSKSKNELQEYYDYCQKTASFIRLKINKFKTETKKTIDKHCCD